VTDSLDVSGLTPDQLAAVTAAVVQAQQLNVTTAEPEPPAPVAEVAPPAPDPEPPAPAPDPVPPAEGVAEPAATAVTEAPTTLPVVVTDLDGAVGDLLDRLRLSRTGNQISTVKDWLTEHRVTL
jgi:hypothetical protein